MTSRKDFLASTPLALAPLLVAATPAPSAKPAASKGPEFAFDRARFDEILGKTAQHKQCFGATKLSDGEVLNAMQNSIQAYETYLHEAPGSFQAVAVLYHGASIGLAMNDEIWNDFLTPFAKVAPAGARADLTAEKLGKGNPYLRSASSSPDDVSVERLVQQGASFFVCHNAVAGLTGALAHTLKKPYAQVHDAVLGGIVPGALVVPAGVMAINACQEAHFTYIAAS